MENLNYRITIETPDREFAEMAIKTFMALKSEVISKAEPLTPQAGILKEKKTEPSKEKKMGEKILDGLSVFEKYLHIIKCCAEDESLLDRLSKALGYQKGSIYAAGKPGGK